MFLTKKMYKLNNQSALLRLMPVIMLITGFAIQGIMLYALSHHSFRAFFALHVLASLLLPWPLYVLIQERFEKSGLMILLFFFLCICIPFIGGIAIYLAVTKGTFTAKQPEAKNFNIVEQPIIPENIVESMAYTQYIGGNIRAIIESSTEENERIRGVLATRQMEDVDAIPILKIAMLDPFDEVRLLAYSMLNSKEKKISGIIQKNMYLLKNTAFSKEEEASRHHYIAEAYWELAYLGLEQGHARIHILEVAKQHTIKALSIFKTDIELYFLMGKIALQLGQYREAAENLQLAAQYGMPEERLAPYNAELAFNERRMGDVSQYIKKIKNSTDKNILSAMVNQWL